MKRADATVDRREVSRPARTAAGGSVRLWRDVDGDV